MQKGNRTKSRYGRFFERFGTVKSWESSGHPLHYKRSVGVQIGVLRTIAASAVTCLRGENSKKEIVKSSTPGPKPYPVTFLLNSTLRVLRFCIVSSSLPSPPSPAHTFSLSSPTSRHLSKRHSETYSSPIAWPWSRAVFVMRAERDRKCSEG